MNNKHIGPYTVDWSQSGWLKYKAAAFYTGTKSLKRHGVSLEKQVPFNH